MWSVPSILGRLSSNFIQHCRDVPGPSSGSTQLTRKEALSASGVRSPPVLRDGAPTSSPCFPPAEGVTSRCRAPTTAAAASRRAQQLSANSRLRCWRLVTSCLAHVRRVFLGRADPLRETNGNPVRPKLSNVCGSKEIHLQESKSRKRSVGFDFDCN